MSATRSKAPKVARFPTPENSKGLRSLENGKSTKEEKDGEERKGNTDLGTQEIDERNGSRAGEKHPEPDLPAYVLQSDSTREHGDEAEEPFTESAGRAAQVAQFQGRNLTTVR